MRVQRTRGLCQCGCGNPAPIARQSVTKLGWVKGEPLRFIRGHGSRKQTPEYETEDRGYETPCWVARRALTSAGYCHVTRDGGLILAHVWHYVEKHGPVPEGLELDHLCRVRACCNPDHLEAVTREENQRRGLATKLTASLVAEIRSSDAASSVLAERYGVTRENIWMIRTRRTWKDVA